MFKDIARTGHQPMTFEEFQTSTKRPWGEVVTNEINERLDRMKNLSVRLVAVDAVASQLDFDLATEISGIRTLIGAIVGSTEIDADQELFDKGYDKGYVDGYSDCEEEYE